MMCSRRRLQCMHVSIDRAGLLSSCGPRQASETFDVFILSTRTTSVSFSLATLIPTCQPRVYGRLFLSIHDKQENNMPNPCITTNPDHPPGHYECVIVSRNGKIPMDEPAYQRSFPRTVSEQGREQVSLSSRHISIAASPNRLEHLATNAV